MVIARRARRGAQAPQREDPRAGQGISWRMGAHEGELVLTAREPDVGNRPLLVKASPGPWIGRRTDSYTPQPRNVMFSFHFGFYKYPGHSREAPLRK